MEDDHPGIVSREGFRRVQDLIAARKDLFYRSSAPSGSVYAGHIFCANCGCVCRRHDAEKASCVMLDYLENARWRTEITPELFEELAERVTVVSAEEVKFRLRNGLELTERLV